MFQKLPAHGGQNIVTGDFGQGGVRYRQITDDGEHPGGQEYPEQGQGQLGAVQFAFGLFRHQVIGGTHKPEQQPYDQQVGVYHAGHIEGNFGKQKIPPHVLQTHDQAEKYLPHKQTNGRNKIRFGNGLGLIL